MKRVLIIVIAVCTAVVIALAIAVRVFITPETVRETLEPVVENTLDREVTIGEIDIGILKGIRVKGFTIKEDDGTTDFLTSDEFILKYRLLPLLSKSVVIDELRIIAPEVRITRNSEGRYNFDSIGKETKSGEVQKKDEDKGSLPLSLLMRSIVIKDATFTLQDDKGEIPEIHGVLNLSTDVTTKGDDIISSGGDLDIHIDTLKTKKPVKKIRDLSVALKYKFDIDLKRGRIHIDKGDIRLQGIPISLTGYVQYATIPSEIDMALSIPETETAEILKSAGIFVDTSGIDLSGRLSTDLKVRGKLADVGSFQPEGVIRLKRVTVTKDNVVTVLDGMVTFQEDILNVDMNSTFGKNTASVKGTVKSYLRNQEVHLNLYAKTLSLDELIVPVPAEKAASPDKEVSQKKPEETKPLDLKMTANGEVKIDSATFRGMNMNDFSMTYLFKNNRLEIQQLTATAGKGAINLRSTVDMSRPGYTYQLSVGIDSLHAQEVVNTFFPEAKDTVFGLLTLNLQMTGSGTTADEIKKNLVGSGDFHIKEGKITNSNIPEKLSSFLGIQELRTIEFIEAEGTTIIKDGTARLKSIFSSEALSMNPTGTIGLDESLDIAFDLRLSPRLTNMATLNTEVASYIKDNDGWGTIPLKVGGTFTTPSYSIDVAKAGKRVIEKKAGKLLEDLLNKDRDQSGNEKEKKEEADPLKGIMKKLF